MEVLPKFVSQLDDVIFQVAPLPFTALSTDFNYLSEFIMVQKFIFILSIFYQHCFLSCSLSSSCAFLWSWILMHHIVGDEIVLSSYTSHFHNLFSLTFQNDDSCLIWEYFVYFLYVLFLVLLLSVDSSRNQEILVQTHPMFINEQKKYLPINLLSLVVCLSWIYGVQLPVSSRICLVKSFLTSHPLSGSFHHGWVKGIESCNCQYRMPPTRTPPNISLWQLHYPECN